MRRLDGTLGLFRVASSQWHKSDYKTHKKGRFIVKKYQQTFGVIFTDFFENYTACMLRWNKWYKNVWIFFDFFIIKRNIYCCIMNKLVFVSWVGWWRSLLRDRLYTLQETILFLNSHSFFNFSNLCTARLLIIVLFPSLINAYSCVLVEVFTTKIRRLWIRYLSHYHIITTKQ